MVCFGELQVKKAGPLSSLSIVCASVICVPLFCSNLCAMNLLNLVLLFVRVTRLVK